MNVKTKGTSLTYTSFNDNAYSVMTKAWQQLYPMIREGGLCKIHTIDSQLFAHALNSRLTIPVYRYTMCVFQRALGHCWPMFSRESFPGIDTCIQTPPRQCCDCVCAGNSKGIARDSHVLQHTQRGGNNLALVDIGLVIQSDESLLPNASTCSVCLSHSCIL